MIKLFVIMGLTGIVYVVFSKSKIGNPLYITIVIGVLLIMASWVVD